MGQPWRDAGYNIVLVDPQHTQENSDGIRRFARTIEDCMRDIGYIIRNEDVSFVFGFPPCTDVAVSGARWWKAKRDQNPYFQAKAALVAEQCRTIGALSGAPWGFENPVSAFSNIFGKPSYTFHPHEFTGYCADDNYTKLTCLWTSEDFVMPMPLYDKSLGSPDNRIHTCPPGKERANFRSATPKGFAKAVFLANHKNEI